eukprot:7639396-Pyramimonas_sp.AAC.1
MKIFITFRLQGTCERGAVQTNPLSTQINIHARSPLLVRLQQARHRTTPVKSRAKKYLGNSRSRLK